MRKRKQTHQELVLQELEDKGYITKLVMQHYGIGNPMDVIRRLRRAGYAINTEICEDRQGHTYPRYTYVGNRAGVKPHSRYVAAAIYKRA